MDRLTQLQDAIDAMARMFTNSIYYVHEKSGMAELNPEIPVTQPKVQADEPQIFQDNVRELVSDLVKKAKEIDALIELLPGIQQTEEQQMELLKSLEDENQQANREYQEAVKEMEQVKEQINRSLRAIADDTQQSSLK